MKNQLTALLFLGLIDFAIAQNTFPASGNVGIGTTSPRGLFDVAGTGDIYLSNNPNSGIGQSIYLPGHIYLSPYISGSDVTYLQARRANNTGSTHLQIRTWNAGALTEAMMISSIGRVGIGTNSPVEKLHVRDGQLMTSDVNYDNINLRVDGRNLPSLRFTRWIGSGSIQHNAFVGQFSNTSIGGEYSLGIGTGYSASGDQNANSMIMTFTLGGRVGIGTSTPGSYKLAVAGSIGAWGEVRVFTNGSAFPDYVFDPSYKLPTLEETENYVKENRHLPEVPSAAEIEKEGMSLNGMNVILLKKVEELTLHLIDMKKEIEELKRNQKDK